MSMMGSASAASASAACIRGAKSSAAEVPMNRRRDKVDRAGARILRDLRTKRCRGFADGSNMKCGTVGFGQGREPGVEHLISCRLALVETADRHSALRYTHTDVEPTATA